MRFLFLSQILSSRLLNSFSLFRLLLNFLLNSRCDQISKTLGFNLQSLVLRGLFLNLLNLLRSLTLRSLGLFLGLNLIIVIRFAEHFDLLKSITVERNCVCKSNCDEIGRAHV